MGGIIIPLVRYTFLIKIFFNVFIFSRNPAFCAVAKETQSHILLAFLKLYSEWYNFSFFFVSTSVRHWPKHAFPILCVLLLFLWSNCPFSLQLLASIWLCAHLHWWACQPNSNSATHPHFLPPDRNRDLQVTCPWFLLSNSNKIAFLLSSEFVTKFCGQQGYEHRRRTLTNLVTYDNTMGAP